MVPCAAGLEMTWGARFRAANEMIEVRRGKKLKIKMKKNN